MHPILKRTRLDDDQRRRLAIKGKVLSRRLLEEVGTLFTPDTILRRHPMWWLRSGITVTGGKRSRDGGRSRLKSGGSPQNDRRAHPTRPNFVRLAIVN